MLYEIAITPDVFDADCLDAASVPHGEVVDLLMGMRYDTILVDLDQGEWSRHVLGRVGKFAPLIRDKIQRLLVYIKDKNRMINYPRREDGPADSDAEWLELALHWNEQSGFDAVIVGDYLLVDHVPEGDNILAVSGVKDSDHWNHKTHQVDVRQEAGSYRSFLAAVLKHARRIDLVDPYMSPSRKHLTVIEICLELMGRYGRIQNPGLLTIHALNSDRGEIDDIPISVQIDNWEQALTGISSRHRLHTLKVMLCQIPQRPVNFHDRHLLTNHFGFGAPSGFECHDPARAAATQWSRHADEIAGRLRGQYSQPGSPFTLAAELELKEGRTIRKSVSISPTPPAA